MSATFFMIGIQREKRGEGDVEKYGSRVYFSAFFRYNRVSFSPGRIICAFGEQYLNDREGTDRQ